MLYFGFLSVTVSGQSEESPNTTDYTREYNSFVKNYNSMVDVMLNQKNDSDAAIVSLSGEHIPYLKQAQSHLSNCLSMAPKDDELRTRLLGYQEKLKFLENM